MKIETDLANLRSEYAKKSLSRSTVARDPFEQFANWFNEALAAEIAEPSAMTLATASLSGIPSARVVLLKGFDPDGFVFYTNYESRKASDLRENPRALIHFFWPELERQVSISGGVEKTTRERSEEYFRSRPFKSRIGAWASKQSSQIESRDKLENDFRSLSSKYEDGEVPLPPFWGGFILRPQSFEFWQGRRSRLHDRILYSVADGNWNITRLSP